MQMVLYGEEAIDVSKSNERRSPPENTEQRRRRNPLKAQEMRFWVSEKLGEAKRRHVSALSLAPEAFGTVSHDGLFLAENAIELYHTKYLEVRDPIQK